MKPIEPQLGNMPNENNLIQPILTNQFSQLEKLPGLLPESQGNGLVLVLQGANLDTLNSILEYLQASGAVKLSSNAPHQTGVGNASNEESTNEINAYLFRQEVNNSLLNTKHKFLQQVNQTIEQHLDNEKLRGAHLANAVCLCEMQLHRKLKKLVSLSPTNYIRKYRLLRSQAFLKEAELSITQVSLMVGFRSLEYFSRSFKSEFCISPTEFRKNVGIV